MENKKPQISIDNIFLMKSNIEFQNIDSSLNLNYSFRLTQVEKQEISDSEMRFIVTFSIDSEEENCPFKQLSASFLAIYKRDTEGAMPWSKLEKSMILAHIVPYFREFVTNISSRMPVKPLYLPPVNTYALLERFKKEQSLKENPKQD